MFSVTRELSHFGSRLSLWRCSSWQFFYLCEVGVLECVVHVHCVCNCVGPSTISLNGLVTTYVLCPGEPRLTLGVGAKGQLL